MTQAFFHSLNIGTLSTWISLAGFGTVGVMVDPWEAPSPAAAPSVEETVVAAPDILLGDGQPAGSGEAASAGAEAPAAPAAGEAELLPAPPEMPPVADLDPLPEIPELPAAPAPAAPAVQPAEAPRMKPAAGASADARPRATSRARAAAGNGPGTGSAGAAGAAGAGGQGTGMSNASRLAAGRMPAPAYPAAARRGGQTGTVVVEFTVDQNGRVISAYAKSPSPWPLLNEEAVRTVRRWKFPPGGIMKLQRPIVFQLR